MLKVEVKHSVIIVATGAFMLADLTIASQNTFQYLRNNELVYLENQEVRYTTSNEHEFTKIKDELYRTCNMFVDGELDIENANRGLVQILDMDVTILMTNRTLTFIGSGRDNFSFYLRCSPML